MKHAPVLLAFALLGLTPEAFGQLRGVQAPTPEQAARRPPIQRAEPGVIFVCQDSDGAYLAPVCGPSLPYAVDKCWTIQDHAPRGFIAFCSTHSPTVYPKCTGDEIKNRPQDVAPTGEAYLEALDCSWKAGKNPREKGYPPNQNAIQRNDGGTQ